MRKPRYGAIRHCLLLLSPTNHLSLSFVLHQYPLTGVIHSTTMELQQVLLAQEPDGADIKPPQIPFCVSNDIENLVFRGGGVKVLYHQVTPSTKTNQRD